MPNHSHDPESREDTETEPEYISEDEDPWTSTCICGSQSPPLDSNDNESPSIMCDICSGATEHWQHNVCMGLPLYENEDEVPDLYICHICDAEILTLQDNEIEGDADLEVQSLAHKETKRALERGERIWERRIETWRRGSLMVRSGLLGTVEVVGDPGVAMVQKKKARLRSWVKPREHVIGERSKATAKAEAPARSASAGADTKQRSQKSKAEVGVPAKVTKKAADQKAAVEAKGKSSGKQPPRKKAKHHDGKSY